MEFFRLKKDIPFMRYGKVTTAISLLTFFFAIWALAHNGLNLGVDFTGGTVLEVDYPQAAQLDVIRTTLEKTGLPAIVAWGAATADSSRAASRKPAAPPCAAKTSA